MKRTLAATLFVVTMTAGAQPRVGAGPEWILAHSFPRPTAPAAGYERPPAIAAAGDGRFGLVTWLDSAQGRTRIAGALFTTGPDPVPAILLGFAFQHDVAFHAMASNGSEQLVVWVERVGRRLYAQRVSGGGLRAGAETFVAYADLAPIAVTAHGNDFVIAYSSGNRSMRATISGDGSVRDRDLPFGPAANRFDLASNSVVALAATELTHDGTPCLFLFCQPSTRRHIVTADPLPAAIVEEQPGPHSPYAAAVSSNGRRFLVAWWTSSAIVGRIHDAAGQPFGDEFVIARLSAPAPRDAASGGNIDIAWTGNTWGVVFEEGSDIRIAFVSASGIALASEMLTRGEAVERMPVILPDRGNGFNVFYERVLASTHSEVAYRQVALVTRSRVVRH